MIIFPSVVSLLPPFPSRRPLALRWLSGYDSGDCCTCTCQVICRSDAKTLETLVGRSMFIFVLLDRCRTLVSRQTFACVVRNSQRCWSTEQVGNNHPPSHHIVAPAPCHLVRTLFLLVATTASPASTPQQIV